MPLGNWKLRGEHADRQNDTVQDQRSTKYKSKNWYVSRSCARVFVGPSLAQPPRAPSLKKRTNELTHKICVARTYAPTSNVYTCALTHTQTHTHTHTNTACVRKRISACALSSLYMNTYRQLRNGPMWHRCQQHGLVTPKRIVLRKAGWRELMHQSTTNGRVTSSRHSSTSLKNKIQV